MVRHESTDYASIGSAREADASEKYGPGSGVIDEMAIYQRALSEPEIATIYQMGFRGESLAATGPSASIPPPESVAAEVAEGVGWGPFRVAQPARNWSDCSARRMRIPIRTSNGSPGDRSITSIASSTKCAGRSSFGSTRASTCRWRPA